jgi:site-specific recombinase XerD
MHRVGREARRDEGNWRAARDYAMEQVILASGVRVSEIRVLAMSDLEFGVLGKAAGDRAGEESLHLVIVPNGVRRTPRRIPVAPFAIEPLKDWLRLRALLAPLTSSQTRRDMVFPSTEQGEPLAACTIYRHVATTLRRAELGKRNVGPQVLRHTFATRQLRKAVSLPTVSAWLGHVQITSTQIYRNLSTAGEPGEVA